jgi:rare lipoprotein A (peptidoglycan hydrolase)
MPDILRYLISSYFSFEASMRITSIATLSALIAMQITPVAAQSFEDRWSVIPKAHAEEPPVQPSRQADPAPPKQAPTDSYAQQPQSFPPATAAGTSERHPAERLSKRSFTGKASFYSYRSGKTASGSSFNRDLPTAAHRKLPFGTRLRVTNLRNNKSVVVTITDRGPKARGRVLDLSLAAARRLGIIEQGVGQVRAEVL